MPQPFYVTTLNLGGTILSTQGGTLSVAAPLTAPYIGDGSGNNVVLSGHFLQGASAGITLDWDSRTLMGTWNLGPATGQFYPISNPSGYVSSAALSSGIYQSQHIDFTKTGIYPFISGIPSGYFYLIDSIDILTLNNATVSGGSPTWGIGSGSGNITQASNIIALNDMMIQSGANFGDRYIYDVPQNPLTGNAYLCVATSGKSPTPFSGIFISRGYMVKYV